MSDKARPPTERAPMDQPLPASIPLTEAMLCEKCREITRRSGAGCANCGQTALITLSGLLEETQPGGLLWEVEQNVWLQRVAKIGQVC
jgi:hypothetical protein